MLRGPFSDPSASSFASGVPGVKKPTPVSNRAGVGPTMAVMKSSWLIAPSSARRMAGLSKGGCRWFIRIEHGKTSVSITSTTSWRWRSSRVETSGGICSNQSISPDISAAEAVAASGMVCHSTRSKCTTFGPAVRPVALSGVGE